jgi:DNA-binding NarL/FixJ family response regulator
VVAIIARITRPKVLIITPHPVIGAGIETVLRLEDLYDVRRASSLADGMAAIGSWAADVALVDGVLLEGRAVDLGVPSYVLSGDAESGERLAERLPGAKGWLPKDAPPARLVQAIDRAAGIVRVREDVRGMIGMVVAVLIVLAFVGAVVLFAWRFFLG